MWKRSTVEVLSMSRKTEQSVAPGVVELTSLLLATNLGY